MCIWSADTNFGIIIIAQVFVGIGAGNVFQPCLIALQAHSPKALRAVVISNRNFLRALGGAVGLACSSQIMQSALNKALPTDLQPLVQSSYDLPQGLTAAQLVEMQGAYAQASRSVFVYMTPVIGLCLILCVFIRDRGLSRKEERQQNKPQDGSEAPQQIPCGESDESRQLSTPFSSNDEDLRVDTTIEAKVEGL